MRVILAVIAVFFIGAAVLRWLAAPAIVEVAIFFLVALVALLLLFVKLTVRVHQAGVDIHFTGGLYNEHIPATAINGASVGPTTTLGDGAGKRHIDGATAFIVGGPTVRIEHNEGATLLSVARPEEAAAVINELVARTPAPENVSDDNASDYEDQA